MQGRHCQGNIWKVNSFPDHGKSGNCMFVQDLKLGNLKIKGSFNKYIFSVRGGLGSGVRGLRMWSENLLSREIVQQISFLSGAPLKGKNLLTREQFLLLRTASSL